MLERARLVMRPSHAGLLEENALADLREAVKAYIEEYGFEDALERINPNIKIREIKASSLKDFTFA